MDKTKIKQILDEKATYYNSKWFIESDPVSIPHRYSLKEDIEISAFLTATLAWGQRPMILKKAGMLMDWMDNCPFEFIVHGSDSEFERFSVYVYRTFNGIDCQYFLSAIKEIYLAHGGLEKVFTNGYLSDNTVFSALSAFRKLFMSFSPIKRTGKHVADVARNATAKRLNMFLRWMVRNDMVVDFGLWKVIKPADLLIPLDVHVGRVARSLGLLNRKQDDWKAVIELNDVLRSFRPDDPVFYDYALFGIGVYERGK